MNLSGLSVKSIIGAYGIDTTHLIIVHDDMDLPVAGIKIRQQGGSGGHKGVQSVIDHLGTESFLRIRIGIGRPEADEDPTEFVLEPCPPAELQMLLSIIQKTGQMIDVIIKDGPQAAMNLFNH